MNLIQYLTENKILESAQKVRELTKEGQLRVNNKLLKEGDYYEDLAPGSYRIQIGDNRTVYASIK